MQRLQQLPCGAEVRKQEVKKDGAMNVDILND